MVKPEPSGTCDFATNPDEDFTDDGDRLLPYGFSSLYPNPYHRLLNELTAIVLPILPTIYLSLWKQFSEDLLEYIEEDYQPPLSLSFDPFDVIKDLRFYDSDIWFHKFDGYEYVQFGFTVKQLNDLELMKRKSEENSALNSNSEVCEVESALVETEASLPRDVWIHSPIREIGLDNIYCFGNTVNFTTLSVPNLMSVTNISLLLKFRSFSRYSAWTRLLFVYCGRPPSFQDQVSSSPIEHFKEASKVLKET